MTRLSNKNMDSIKRRLPRLEERYKSLTGKSMLEIGCIAAQTEYIPLETRKHTKVACVPITAGEGIIHDFSETLVHILRSFTDVTASVTESTDVAGINEAIEHKADVLFIADDKVCLCRNLNTGATSDNGYATGRGFATLLCLAGTVQKKKALILGAGKVGKSAFDLLSRQGALVSWYDVKQDPLFDLGAASRVEHWEEYTWPLLVDATTSPDFIKEEHITSDCIIAAPGIPSGLTETSRQKAHIVFDDELETGVVVMLCEALKRDFA